jgi:hypothetical protein
MRQHDESRRAFLIGAAMGAAATTALVPDAIAQTHEQHEAVAAPAEAAAPRMEQGTALSSMTTIWRPLLPLPSG